jgi:hypothetical protein
MTAKWTKKDRRADNQQLSITDSTRPGMPEIVEILGSSGSSRASFLTAGAERALNDTNRIGQKTIVAIILSVIGCATGIPGLCLHFSSKVRVL